MEKVSNVVISRFLMESFRIFLELNVNFWHILHYSGILGLLRCFVATLVCRNLRTFSGKMFLAETMFV